MEQLKPQRKLAAILHADVVGYSRLMGTDEELTLRTLKDHRMAMVDLIHQHHGQVVGTAGDSLLAEFPSVVEAVQCAVNVQEALRARNASLPDECKLQFRVGINLGDVIVDGDDIYGDGVNVAARVEALAEPGGISVSGAVYDAIGTKLPLTFQFTGEQSVKNIAAPIRVYRVLPQATPNAEPAAGKAAGRAPGKLVLGAALLFLGLLAVGLWGFIGPVRDDLSSPEPAPGDSIADKPSIAVLPFDNLSGDAEQEYFADGMTDDLITDLTKLSGLLVIARDSTFHYKNRPLEIREVARRLDVRYIIHGSVRRTGELVRVNAQLVDTATERHIWADRYDGQMPDVFQLQDEMTQDIIAALPVNLSPTEQRRLGQQRTRSPEAYDLFLYGRSRFFLYASKEENQNAREFFRQASELDPQFASAYAMRAWTHWFDFVNGWSDAPERSLQRAEALAEQALALDDALPVAHFVLGLVHRERRDYVKALVEAERAIAIDPNYANGHVLLATILYYAGRPREGLERMQQAIRLNPHHPHNYPFHLGQAHFVLKEYSAAIDAFKQGLESYPDSERLHVWLAAAYARAGDIDEAQWEADQLLSINPDFSIRRIEGAFPFKDPADLASFTDGLRMAGLPE